MAVPTTLNNPTKGYMSSNTIYTSTRALPYVYVCTHKTTGQFYIGYRELNVSMNRPSSIDLPRYKTSSKFVKPHFDQFEWKVIAEFFEPADAFEFEQRLIFENWDNPLLINEQYRLPKGNTAFKTKKGCNKGRKNPALSLRNKTVTPWNKGLTKADNINLARAPHTDEGKALRSVAMKEWHKNNAETFICDHCGKVNKKLNHDKWHGANCKLAR